MFRDRKKCRGDRPCTHTTERKDGPKAHQRSVFSSVPQPKLSKGAYSPLCHLDRSEAQWRDLCVDALSWKCFSAAAFSPLAIKRLARGELSEERTRLRIYPRTDHHRSIPQDVAAHKDPHGAIAGQAKYQQLNNRPSCPPLQLARQSSSARIAREVG